MCFKNDNKEVLQEMAARSATLDHLVDDPQNTVRFEAMKGASSSILPSLEMILILIIPLTLMLITLIVCIYGGFTKTSYGLLTAVVISILSGIVLRKPLGGER
ncbi:hypothetical protein KQX54_003722 [Cotesia glomerata]|uniref:Uncharacterized protein n=1 Tax=Cotesia glomerata TaxID=32391 RepID=A0AAV7IUB1_COTGL|nr:hypothetical protein KQX54_003722 [Cotesia glomerata]